MKFRNAMLLAGVMLCAATPAAADAKPKKAKAVALAPSVESRTVWAANAERLRAAELLAKRLDTGIVDGYLAGPEMADYVRKNIEVLRRGADSDKLIADSNITTVYADYVAKLYSPVEGMIYGESSVRPRAASQKLLQARIFDAADPVEEVRQMLDINPIHAQLREAVYGEYLRVGESALTDAALSSIARSRAFPAKGRFVLVDAATARLWMYEDGRAVDSMKVIVGKAKFATPMIASRIHYAVHNPYWHVPEHLNKNIARGYLAKGEAYMRRMGYQAVDEWGDEANILDNASIDWKAVRDGRADVKIRQLPGGENFMGKVKFPFNNGEGIFLHDTPSKALFDKVDRQLSNGCVRLEDAPRLAAWLGSARSLGSANPEDLELLPKGTPVYISYLTVQADGAGDLIRTADVYQRDKGPALLSMASYAN